MKKKLFWFFLIVLFSFSAPLAYATITPETPPYTGFRIHTGQSSAAFYAQCSTSHSLVYNVNNTRWYAGYARYEQSYTDTIFHYSYSDAGDPTTWTSGGRVGLPAITENGVTFGNYPVGAGKAFDYCPATGYFHAAWSADQAHEIVYYRSGTDSGDGSISWGSIRVVKTGLPLGNVDITFDDSGIPIISFAGKDDAATVTTYAVTVAFANDTKGTDWTTQTWAEAPTANMLFASVFPTGNASAYVVVADSGGADPLYGAHVTNTTSSPFTLTAISDGNCMGYVDGNTIRSVGLGLSHDPLFGHIVYEDSDYDLKYFNILIDGMKFLPEIMLYNGTITQHLFNPIVSIDDYTPFVFGWNITDSPPDMLGMAMEVTSSVYPITEDDWSDSYNVVNGTWGVTEFEYTCASRSAGAGDVMIGYTEGVAHPRGAIFGALGYGEPYILPFDVSADLENVDDDGADWVFTDWKYYTFTVTTNLTVLDNASIAFLVPTGEEDIMCGFWSDGEDWIYQSNMTYESREGEPCILKAGSWNETSGNLTFPIWFESRILDVWDPSNNMDVLGSYNSSEWFTAETNLFRIYSKGGFELNFAATGAAGKLAGGTPFSLYANNGSIVYNEIWYRDGQHIKLMPDIHFLTGLEEFHVRYGVDYSLGNGTWLSGWSLLINPKFVSYTGIFAANVWINMTNLWWGRVTEIFNEDLYMFYHGSVSGEGDPGHWKSWVDLWFSDKNASKVGAGRYNAYEFPMIDNADLWLRWLASNWGVKDNVLKEMSVEYPLLDEDNSTAISSEKIKMMRFWCELEVDDTDSGQYISIENYEAFDVTHSRDLPLVGMSNPVFDETLIPTVGQKGILGALFSLFASLAQWMSEDVIFGGLNLWSTFVNFLDTIAGMFGAPTFFSDLFAWLAELFGYLVISAEYLITILADIFELMAALMVTFLDTMGDIITVLVNTFTMISDMLGGAYGAGINIWDALGLSQWLTVVMVFYPIYLIILWDTKGMDAVIQHLTWLFGILTWVFQFLVSVIQFVLHLVERIIESIPVVE